MPKKGRTSVRLFCTPKSFARRLVSQKRGVYFFSTTPFCLPMKRFILPLTLFLLIVVGVVWYTRPAVNPDPNHNHADFAVYISGQKVDFSKSQYMSGSSTGSLADA